MLHTTHFPVSGSALPPVALLHGFASSADEDFLLPGWARALTEAGRSVITVDLPGHGKSGGVDSPAAATTGNVLDAILAAIGQHAPDGEFDVIGYSLGARLAWDLPSRSDRIRRIVLGGLSPMEPFGAVGREDLAAALGGEAPANPLVGIMAAMIQAPGRDTASLANVIAGLASEPFAPEHSRPAVPALLVAGEADGMTEGIDGLAELLPDARLVRVPGDHRGALDSAKFRAAAIDFLA